MGRTVKDLTESNDLKTVPSEYVFPTNPEEVEEAEQQIPIIDYHLLTSGSPDQRSQIIENLRIACLDWGFFMVINHGVAESLINEMMNLCLSFFDLSPDEKSDYVGKDVLNPIRCGTSFNTSVENVYFWRDYLKVLVHPDFHAPLKPNAFRNISYEYCKRTREVAKELVNAISESLGLQGDYIEKALETKSGLQILIVNLYPPCPQPELAMGMPPHSDHGLLTLLAQNEIGGLQIKHKGKWIVANALPNSFMVNIGDHMEILSNGKYKSILHRVAVNTKATRVTVVTANGPSLDAVVTPAPDLVDSENYTPLYRGMKYREYVELQQSNQLDRKSCLDRIRV
ncbi:protein DMR6-LIKE OXYGENASE 2-like [Papaver somniferum]|uniref:DMR6-like oxygenase 2 n=1 Tax=Papaver somniferum TaxID=3469 RepID=A0A5B7LKB4_PAPSO|nr:protein DMR6-LIKE OXYGENASE 2-like [Papaver somniferum]QBG82655.1 DMR6-like oxygenase 2 [Papaver somniferum]